MFLSRQLIAEVLGLLDQTLLVQPLAIPATQLSPTEGPTANFKQTANIL